MAETQSQVTIYDDPESRVQFLERTLGEKDWRTTLVYPDGDAVSQQKLRETKAALEKRGYVVSEGRNAQQHPILDIHHIGNDTPVNDILREMGLARGTGHVVSNPGIPLGQMLEAGQHGIDSLGKLVRDPARFNGMIFTLAEVFLFFAGWGSKSGKITDPKNLMQTLAGSMFLGQSLIYLTVARSNDEVAFDQVKKKIERTQQHGKTTHHLEFDPAVDQPKVGIGHTVASFLNKYPIQIGAMFNNVGMLLYLRHAVLENQHHLKTLLHSPHDADALRYVKHGFRKDIAGGLTSLVAWSIMLIPPKPHDPEKPRSENPIINLWERFRENPQFLTGGLTLTSSSMRLAGSLDKRNWIQTIGEGIYLPGDILLMFTKNTEYGHGASDNLDKLAGRLANYIINMPMAMGPKARTEMTDSMVNYLQRYGFETLPASDRTPQKKAALQRRSETIRHDILRKLDKQMEDPFDKMVDSAAAIASRFPEARRDEMRTQLAAELSQMPWVHASTEEIQQGIMAATVRHRVPAEGTKLVQMRDISADIAKLTFTVPGLDAAATALIVQKTLAPFMRAQESDAQHLNKALTAHAEHLAHGSPAPATQALAR